MSRHTSVDESGSTASSSVQPDPNGANDVVDTPFPPNPLETRNPLIYRVILAALLALAVFLMIYSWNLGVGSLKNPASGLWVFIVAGLIILSLPVAFMVKEKFEVFDRDRVKRSMIMVAGLILFVVLYPLLGFVLAGAVSLFIISRWSAEESIRSSLIISIATPVVLYLLFGVMFRVSLNLIPGWL